MSTDPPDDLSRAVTGSFLVASLKLLLTDARAGVVVTGRLIAAAAKRPMGPESADWRGWLYPAYVAVVAPLPLVGAAAGFTSWVTAIPASFVIGLVALFMLGRLARRYAREHPDEVPPAA